MLLTNSRLIEYTTIRLTVEGSLDLSHARWLRGAIGRQIDRTEFHHHTNKGFLYQHPLIRYHACGSEAMIFGIAEGAFLIRTLPVSKTLRLGDRTYRVLDQRTEANRLNVGPCEGQVIYRFQTPYLALNQENYPIWHRANPFARRRLLQRVVIGNLLSLSKALNLHVAEELHAEVDLAPDQWYDLKPGVRLLGFQGWVQVNFLLPNRWGIGKSSARGFGTLTREEV